MGEVLAVWKSQQPTPWTLMLQDVQWRGASCNQGQVDTVPWQWACSQGFVSSDAEILLIWEGRLDGNRPNLIHAYQRWGLNFIEHVLGDFSFILWDEKAQRLLAGSDLMGSRNLTYFWDSATETLLISSRLLALLRHPQVNLELDPYYLAATLLTGWPQRPGLTPFRHLKRITPGHILVLEAGHITCPRVAHLTPKPRDFIKSSQYYEAFNELLAQAVQDRIQGDGTVCTTVSGGLDSTVVTAHLWKVLPTAPAFSMLTTKYPEFDESDAIQAFRAYHPAGPWQGVAVDEALNRKQIASDLPLWDDPLVFYTLPLHVQLCQAMQGHQVCLDGEWGDAIFGTNLQDLVQGGAWSSFFGYVWNKPRPLNRLWAELGLARLPSAWQQVWLAQRYPLTMPWLTEDYTQSVAVQEVLSDYYQSLAAKPSLPTLLEFYESTGATAGGQILQILRAHFGITFTSPLFDRRVVEFALGIPPQLQASPHFNKIFLRQATAGYLPDLLRWRPKQNHFTPLRQIHFQQDPTWTTRLSELSYLQGIINPTHLETPESESTCYNLLKLVQWSEHLQQVLGRKVWL